MKKVFATVQKAIQKGIQSDFFMLGLFTLLLSYSSYRAPSEPLAWILVGLAVAGIGLSGFLFFNSGEIKRIQANIDGLDKLIQNDEKALNRGQGRI